MHMLRTFILACGLTLAVGSADLPAQEAVPIPTPGEHNPAPSAAKDGYPDIESLPKAISASTPSGYPDIESLRTPGSSLKLLPPPPVATPAPGTLPGGRGQNRLGTTQGGTRQGGGALGRKRNSGRQHDVLVDIADADPLEVRVSYRHAKTIAMAHDPGMADLLKQADAADTDVEKRAFLKQYYAHLYDGIEKVDTTPEMKKHVDTLRLISSSRFDPRRREVGGDEDIVLGRGGGRRGGGRNR